MKYTSALLFLMIVVISCAEKPVEPFPGVGRYVFSFENDLGGWLVKSTDVESPPCDWSIQRSDEHKLDGQYALRFSLDNLTDAGKIWVERSFAVRPRQVYRVNVTYSFASRDFGGFNLWTLIAHAGNRPASNHEDLSYQDETGNGSESDIGFQWMEKSYDFVVESSPEGFLFVDVGVWGTWEGPRTYYFDPIIITVTEASG